MNSPDQNRTLLSALLAQDVDRPIDMVQVFRRSDELPDIASLAIKVGAHVRWGQIGVYHEEAARIAEDTGQQVVMDRCSKIELYRPFWKPKLHLSV